jgi:phytoene/squalene synthetase
VRTHDEVVDGEKADVTFLAETERRVTVDGEHMCGASGGDDVVHENLELLRQAALRHRGLDCL